MNEQVEHVQHAAQDQLHQMGASSESFADGMKTIMEETVSYSQRSMQNYATFMQKLFNQRSLETALQLQADFASSQFEDFLTQTKKIGAIYQGMGKMAAMPMQSAWEKTKEAVHH